MPAFKLNKGVVINTLIKQIGCSCWLRQLLRSIVSFHFYVLFFIPFFDNEAFFPVPRCLRLLPLNPINNIPAQKKTAAAHTISNKYETVDTRPNAPRNVYSNYPFVLGSLIKEQKEERVIHVYIVYKQIDTQVCVYDVRVPLVRHHKSFFCGPGVRFPAERWLMKKFQ